MDKDAEALRTAISSGKVQAIGIAWYNRNDYPEILRIMADGANLPRSYDQWLQKMTKREQDVIATGVKTVRVIIEPQAFLIWCQRGGYQVDTKARTAFAAQQAAIQQGLVGN